MHGLYPPCICITLAQVAQLHPEPVAFVHQDGHVMFATRPCSLTLTLTLTLTLILTLTLPNPNPYLVVRRSDTNELSGV